MINKIVNQKNLSVIYLAESEINYMITVENSKIQINYNDPKQENQTISAGNTYQISELEASILKNKEIKEEEKNLFLGYIWILFFFILFLVLYKIFDHYSEKELVEKKKKNFGAWSIAFGAFSFLTGIYLILMIFCLQSYLNKIKKLFNVINNNEEIKEENPELFNQLQYYYGFRNIIFYLSFFILTALFGFLCDLGRKKIEASQKIEKQEQDLKMNKGNIFYKEMCQEYEKDPFFKSFFDFLKTKYYLKPLELIKQSNLTSMQLSKTQVILLVFLEYLLESIVVLSLLCLFLYFFIILPILLSYLYFYKFKIELKKLDENQQ